MLSASGDPPTTATGEAGSELTLVTHRAADRDGVAALTRRADLLRRAAHPGVVEVRSWRVGGTTAELVLVEPAGGRLVDHPPTDWRDGTVIVAGVAETIADLHAIGVCHGAVHPADIALDDHGHPVLCGFEHADHALDPASTARDVDDLARLVEWVLIAVDDVPARARRALVAIVDDASSGRCTARDVARRCAEVSALAVTTSIVPAVVVVLAVASVLAWWNARHDDRDTTTRVAAAASTTTAPTATLVTSSTIAPAPEIVHAGGTYRVGSPGDIVLLGDWRCTGVEMPALLRPSTGAVFVFDAWPTGDAAVSVESVARHAGADGLTRRPNATCDDLVVTSPAGPVVVPLAGVAR